MMAFRAAIVLAGFLFVTVMLMPVQLVLRGVWREGARRLPHLYHRWLARWLGLRITVAGDPLPTGGALLVSNHVSWLDIVAISCATPVSFIAKHEVGTWPLFGWMAKLQATEFVNRERRQRTAQVRDAIAKRIRQGDRLVLFAEGTSHDGFTLLPFKPALLGAAETGGDVPVVPVTLAYDRHFGLPMTRRMRPFYAWYGDMQLPPHLWAAMASGPIGVTVFLHPPLPRDMTRKDMAKAAETQIRDRLARLLHGR